MKRIVSVMGVVALVSLVGLFVAGCDGKKDDGDPKPAMDHKGHEGGETAKPAAAEIAQKTCPVMGGAINKEIFTDHNGRRVYFCCGGCVDAIKKDPAKYLAKIDAEIKKAKDAALPGN